MIFMIYMRIVASLANKITKGYLRKLFFDAKVKKYVRNQGETMEPGHS